MRKTRILSIFALLLTAVTGAWAQEESLLTTITPDYRNFATYTVADVAEVSGSNVDAMWDPESDDYWMNASSTAKGQLTVTGKEGYTITRVVFTVMEDPYSGSTRTKEYTEAPYAVYPYWTEIFPTQADQDTRTNSLGFGVTKIEVYGYVTPAAPATLFDLTLADGSDAHGTVAFTVDGAAATQAKKDDVVTVSVTPATGYSTKDVTVRAYTTWAAAPARAKSRAAAPELKDNIDVTAGENGTWTFTMPEANVWVVVTYTKNLQDAWIEAIADQTYTGEAIEPTVTVKDGETTLTLGTDYTVAYADNTDAGTATVTITAVAGSDYSGTASKTFTIAKAAGSISYAETSVSKTFGDEAFTNELTMTGDGTVTYASDNVNVAVVDSETGLVTIIGTGTATIKATIADGDNYTYATNTAQYTLKVAADKTALSAAVAEAETWYELIKDYNPVIAGNMLPFINTGKELMDDPDAVQEAVDSITDALLLCVAAAQADVALKRVTITIPAKSYVARVDADKRQIETAVSGVSLYSVKNVTNTEVELTAELSVVKAEMPYLIYNDNDEEVTVSIVVSSEEADDVQYDSDHFKGTLVDKTFTDEDMQAADHYVLSNGHDFVWVKDAGTLAAGKCWVELVPSSPAHARALSIVFEGTTTGINAVSSSADKTDGEWYDLSGRRVAQPTKGIYVKNGRKIIVK